MLVKLCYSLQIYFPPDCWGPYCLFPWFLSNPSRHGCLLAAGNLTAFKSPVHASNVAKPAWSESVMGIKKVERVHEVSSFRPKATSDSSFWLSYRRTGRGEARTKKAERAETAKPPKGYFRELPWGVHLEPCKLLLHSVCVYLCLVLNGTLN